MGIPHPSVSLLRPYHPANLQTTAARALILLLTKFGKARNLEAGLQLSLHLSRITMDHLYGKTTDVVDFGGETDYEGYEWFQDAPPRPQVWDISPAAASSNLNLP